LRDDINSLINKIKKDITKHKDKLSLLYDMKVKSENDHKERINGYNTLK
jgi:hypothetical protein